MAKCDCYFQHGLKFLCYGTKEMEECSCGGDKSKCDFYPEKRQQKPKAKRQIVDVQEAKTFIDANWPNDPLLKQIAFNLLDKLPKVDTVEVVHGEWLYDSGSESYFCSACKEFALSTSKDVPQFDYDWEENLRYSHSEIIYEEHLTNYCPECGAKMDGDGK